jgi:hypothetical protein
MDASIVDLRYKMHDVLKALSRRETVRILYRGKLKGEIVPSKSNRKMKTKDHPLFGSADGGKERPEETVAKMRRSRRHDF